MSSAIEVLKDKLEDARYYTCMEFPEKNDEDILAFKEAIVALEQKEKLKVWLERNIKKDVEMGSFTDWWTDGHITALKEVLELMKDE